MSEQAQTANETQAANEMGTKPVPEHEWLQNLVGDWRVDIRMNMGPDQPPQTAEGTESVLGLGGLWAFGGGTTNFAEGSMSYYFALGFDVSFKEYRGCMFMSMSSHLWKQTGELSADGKTMTLNCVGPHMEKDGETANYRDVIELIDENRRTRTSLGQDDSGAWHEFMKATYTRK